MSGTFTSLTIVVGATDEEKTLIDTVACLTERCSARDIADILIVFSGDASQGCRRAIDQLERQHPGIVRGIQQTRPHIGGAIRDGFDAARSSHIMLLAGDLAIDPASVPALIEIAKQFPDDIAKTSRWTEKDSFFNYSVTRKALNRCAQIFLRVLFCTKQTDLTNPVQIMPLELYKAIDWKEQNFPILLELVLTPLRLGIKFHETGTRCYGRTEGKSKNTLIQTARYLSTALRIRFAKKDTLWKNT